MSLRRCGRCKLEKPVEEFSWKDSRRGLRQSYCRLCANLAWREWYERPGNRDKHLVQLAVRRKRRIQANRSIVRFFKQRACSDCRGSFPPEVMDFDHVSGKQREVSALVFTVSSHRLVEEIARCEVVCANCHRLRTVRRLRARKGR